MGRNNCNVKSKNFKKMTYLTKSELKRVLTVCLTLRSIKEVNERNYCILLMSYQHGMRVSEAITLEWQNVNFDSAALSVVRAKGSSVTTQVMSPPLLKYLRKMKRYDRSTQYVFAKSTGELLTRQSINVLCTDIEKELKLGKKFNPHMLKHSAGVHLAMQGKNIREIQYHLGHKSASNTLIYMNYAPTSNGNDLRI